MKDDINLKLKLDKPIRIVNIFDEKYKDKYTLNISENRILLFLGDTFNDAMYKCIHKKYNKKDCRLFISLVYYTLEKDMCITPNGKVIKRFTNEQRKFLILLLCNGWDFRWIIPNKKTNSMKKLETSFNILSSQINSKDSIYKSYFKESFDIAVKDNKSTYILFDNEFGCDDNEREFINLLYCNGFSIEKNAFGDYIVKSNKDTICKVNKELLSSTYINLLKSLLLLKVDISYYLYCEASEDEIRLHRSICEIKEIDFKYIKDLDGLLVNKLLTLDFTDINYINTLAENIDKEAFQIKKNYNNLIRFKEILLSN